MTQLIALRLGLSQGSALQVETLAMHRHALSFLRQLLGWEVTQGSEELALCRGPGQEFPGTLAWQCPLRLALLARGLQEAATRIAQVTFQRIVGPRQPLHVIAVQQAGPIAPADLVEVVAQGLSERRERRAPLDGIARAPEGSRNSCSAHRLPGTGL